MEKSERKPFLTKSSYKEAGASPGFLFSRTFNAWSRRLRIELDKVGLTQVQYSIIATLSYIGSAKEHVSQQDIANQLSMDKMMISDVVKALETKKMIVRKSHPHDGRSFSLSLTEAAKRCLIKAVPLVEATDENFFSVLNPRQRSAFVNGLIRLGTADAAAEL